MITHDEVVDILGNITCGRIKWRVEEVTPYGVPEANGVFIQPVFTVNGEEQHGRKWYVSAFSCRSEVVQTAFKAALTAAEHELRETFLYKGRAIFGPHLNVEALHEFANGRNLEVRDETKSK
jgi:hypothetical protein